MKVFFAHIILLSFIMLKPLTAVGQNIEPKVEFTSTKDGEVTLVPGDDVYTDSAPLKVRCSANPYDYEGWNATFEWRFTMDGETEPYLIRYEQDTEYTFTKAGSHNIVCYAVFTRGDERVEYTEEYWTLDTRPIMISVSQSKLEMPNIFTPKNGDDFNNTYGAKPGYQSIVEFRAIIFNRWGKKLYEWNDPAGGWDGTYKGKDMPQGVYFVFVQAKGADGRTYTIKRDVNLLRNRYDSSSSSSSGSDSTGE